LSVGIESADDLIADLERRRRLDRGRRGLKPNRIAD
jgi:hypothetical protein